MENFALYYDLEGYLFQEVSERYKKSEQISVFDFFCIVIWKSNRSKSTVAKRLLRWGYPDLQSAVTALTVEVSRAQGNKN